MKKKTEYYGVEFTVDSKTLEITSNVRLYSAFFKGLQRWYITWIGKDKKQHLTPRARIICQAFHPNPDYKSLVCDHIDSDTTNDKPSNLRWTTVKGNNSTRHSKKMKSSNATKKIHYNEVIKAVDLATGEETYYANGRACAAALNCSSTLVYNVLNSRHFAKTAMNHTLEWVPVDELTFILKKEASDRRSQIARDRFETHLRGKFTMKGKKQSDEAKSKMHDAAVENWKERKANKGSNK